MRRRGNKARRRLLHLDWELTERREAGASPYSFHLFSCCLSLSLAFAHLLYVTPFALVSLFVGLSIFLALGVLARCALSVAVAQRASVGCSAKASPSHLLPFLLPFFSCFHSCSLCFPLATPWTCHIYRLKSTLDCS